MSITLPLHDMSVEEKIQAMESLWTDLCENADSLSSPAWHGELLADREAAMAIGADQFIDWETAKESIKKELK